MGVRRFLCIVVAIFLGSDFALASSVTVLFTHDLHSNFKPAPQKAGGFAALAAAIQAERQKSPANVLVLDAGDFSMGNLFHTLFTSEAAELRLMGELGIDATTLGNHDFDFRPRKLAEMLSRAKSVEKELQPGKPNFRLPLLLVANTKIPDSLPDVQKAFAAYGVQEWKVLERGGLRIGVFGIIGKDAAGDAPFASPITFSDPIQAATDAVKVLREKENVDIVIALSHSGTNVDPSHSEDEILAAKVPGIDVIVSGHTHTVLNKPIIIGRAHIVAAGSDASALGILKLNVDNKNVSLASYSVQHFDSRSPADAAMSELIAHYEVKANSDYLAPFGYQATSVIAEAAFPFEPLSYASANKKEVGLGNLIADAYRQEGGKYCNSFGMSPSNHTLAIVPRGTVRADFPQGVITVSDIFRTLSLGLGEDGQPGFPLICAYFNREELLHALEVETTIADFKRTAGLYVSGLHMTYNPYRMMFDRLQTVVFDKGEDPRALYPVVMSLYTAKMIGVASKLSHGLLQMTPKDKSGTELVGLEKFIIDKDLSTSGVQELKEWEAVANFLKSMKDTNGNGIPDVPVLYSQSDSRTVGVQSWSPVSLLWPMGFMTRVIVGLVLLLGLLGTIGTRWLMKRQETRAA